MHCMKDSAFVMKINLSEYFSTIEIDIFDSSKKNLETFFPQFFLFYFFCTYYT